MRGEPLTPIRPWDENTIAIVADCMNHALEGIRCSCCENDVLLLHWMDGTKVAVKKGRQCFAELRITAIRRWQGEILCRQQMCSACCSFRTLLISLSSTVVLKNSTSSGRSTSFCAFERSMDSSGLEDTVGCSIEPACNSSRARTMRSERP
jgi:hypothetical protein